MTDIKEIWLDNLLHLQFKLGYNVAKSPDADIGLTEQEKNDILSLKRNVLEALKKSSWWDRLRNYGWDNWTFEEFAKHQDRVFNQKLELLNKQSYMINELEKKLRRVKRFVDDGLDTDAYRYFAFKLIKQILDEKK